MILDIGLNKLGRIGETSFVGVLLIAQPRDEQMKRRHGRTAGLIAGSDLMRGGRCRLILEEALRWSCGEGCPVQRPAAEPRSYGSQ